MSNFISGLAPALDGLLDYREALGFSRQTYMSSFINLDRYCADNYPGEDTVSKDMVYGWLFKELDKVHSNINIKATAVRLLGKYISAVGRDAYMLPDDAASRKTVFEPYIFTDSELSSLFRAADILSTNSEDSAALIAPVIFRLIYTCGLRPNEGRELLRSNVNLETGEILITKTKRKKERMVVMSDDMISLCVKYSKQAGTSAAGSEYFFPCEDGGDFAEQRIDRLFKRCWALANPMVSSEHLPSVRVYDLRHRFASAVLNRWLDEKRNLYVMLPYLRAYMGHVHMSETAYYIHILPENLIKLAGVDWAALEAVMPEVSIWQD